MDGHSEERRGWSVEVKETIFGGGNIGDAETVKIKMKEINEIIIELINLYNFSLLLINYLMYMHAS